MIVITVNQYSIMLRLMAHYKNEDTLRKMMSANEQCLEGNLD